jgi:hypothetical protein
MVKKLTALGMVAVMLLGVFALTGCNNTGQDLAEYKTEGKAQIDAHVATKTQSDYSDENWEAICKAATDGKQAVEEATTKSQVDTAVGMAKAMINEVRKEGAGMFYTLQEAYDEGWLTQDNLRSIAHYQSAGEDEPNFTPTPMNPKVLSNEAIEAIKEEYLKGLLAATHQDGTLLFPNATISDVYFLAYYGTYGGVIAIKISDEFSGYAGVVVELVVAGVTFTYSGVPVSIWKAN